MNEDQVRKSFEIDRSWQAMWSYTFGLREYSEEELKITNLTYDATLSDLDDLFKSLVTTLENSGHLDDTVVILTSDHGEHLGEQHMFDHQYTIYEAVCRVPLVVWYPKRFKPGRDSRPVMNFDIFPTLLELAGVEINEKFKTMAVSLSHPQNQRVSMSECPGYPDRPFDSVKKVYPDFDPTPWERTLRAVYKDKYKYIAASDGRDQLFSLLDDPNELKDLSRSHPHLIKKLAKIHDKMVADFVPLMGDAQKGIPLTEDEEERLESLGYVGSKRD
jgi:arylsulfatase A-like enzyme